MKNYTKFMKWAVVYRGSIPRLAFTRITGKI